MESNYELVFLSDLYNHSRRKSHPDFVLALDCFFHRLDDLGAASPDSQFNKMMHWLKRVFPRSLLIKLLYHLRYDAIIGFREEDGKREIYGMISFQKHPARFMIGMFDIYILQKRRHKDLAAHFSVMAELLYRLCQSFKHNNYRYIQCGDNDTTRKILRLYKRVARKNNWEGEVDVDLRRIYLSGIEGKE